MGCAVPRTRRRVPRARAGRAWRHSQPPARGAAGARRPFADVLRDLDEILLPGTTHWQSPRFFAYFVNSAAEPGILAELLAATLNSVAFIWRTSPASTELEAHTLDWVAQLLGLPSGWHGHIADTASISTIAALAAARESNGGSVVVCSEEAHSSVERAARLLGLETRKVPLDDEFRLDADALDLTDATALVATVGTTSTTAVDPVPALADACEAAGIWLHVDAAYAGSAWVCPELRWSQAGGDIAMVFQSYALYPHMTVYENLAFGLRNQKVPKKDIDRRVRRAADILDLDPLIKRKPKQLSGGQRQRVALGRAIVREPEAFLMDEPLSNLDAQLRVQTRAEILKLQQELETTTIYVTHDQVEAMTMGDRIAVMKLGILQQVGSPEELYREPRDLFVAGFIGPPAMNLARRDHGRRGCRRPYRRLPSRAHRHRERPLGRPRLRRTSRRRGVSR